MLRNRTRARGETTDVRWRRTARVRECRLRAVMAYGMAAIGVACHSYYPASASTDLRGDMTIDVQFAGPSAVTIATPTGDSLRREDLKHLRGRVLAAHADTLTMQKTKIISRMDGVLRSAGAPGTTARVVLASGDELRVEHFSAPKTTLFVAGLLAIGLVGFAAIGLSTMKP